MQGFISFPMWGLLWFAQKLLCLLPSDQFLQVSVWNHTLEQVHTMTFPTKINQVSIFQLAVVNNTDLIIAFGDEIWVLVAQPGFAHRRTLPVPSRHFWDLRRSFPSGQFVTLANNMLTVRRANALHFWNVKANYRFQRILKMDTSVCEKNCILFHQGFAVYKNTVFSTIRDKLRAHCIQTGKFIADCTLPAPSNVGFICGDFLILHGWTFHSSYVVSCHTMEQLLVIDGFVLTSINEWVFHKQENGTTIVATNLTTGKVEKNFFQMKEPYCPGTAFLAFADKLVEISMPALESSSISIANAPQRMQISEGGCWCFFFQFCKCCSAAELHKLATPIAVNNQLIFYLCF